MAYLYLKTMINSAKYKALAMHDVFLKETNKTSCTLKHLNFIQHFKLKLIVLVLVTLNSDYTGKYYSQRLGCNHVCLFSMTGPDSAELHLHNSLSAEAERGC